MRKSEKMWLSFLLASASWTLLLYLSVFSSLEIETDQQRKHYSYEAAGMIDRISFIDVDKRSQRKHSNEATGMIDRIYFINLDKNPLRRAFMEGYLSNQTIPFERIPGKVGDPSDTCVEGKTDPDRCRGIVGLAKSEISIIDNYNTTGLTLVFEDDYFAGDILPRLQKSMSLVPDDWDILRFGCWGHIPSDFPVLHVNPVNELGINKIFETRHDKKQPPCDGTKEDCWFSGGTHAMVWRGGESVQKLKELWSRNPRQDVDSALTGEDNYITSYCINFRGDSRKSRIKRIKGEASNIPLNPAQRRGDIITSPSKTELWSIPLNAAPWRGDIITTPSKEFLTGKFNLSGIVYSFRFPRRFQAKQAAMMPSRFDGLPNIVFGVLSSAPQFAKRDAIRASWAYNESAVFILAGDWNPIAKEFDERGDIIWVNATEDYRTGLTRKTMAFIVFAAAKLSQSNLDYIFKADDDSFVNATQIRLELSQRNKLLTQKTGQLEVTEYYGRGCVRSRPVRDVTSKWYMSREVYSKKYFPIYAFGIGYALSTNFASCAMSKMKDLQAMDWEDVATGMLARKCGKSLTRSHWDDQLLPNDHWTGGMYFPFNVLKDGGHSVAVLHGVKPEYMIRLHRKEPLPALS
jgi:hypothetical protein